MSLTTQSFTYALNNIEELTKFSQNRGSNIINDKDNDFNENTTFVIYTMFDESVFTMHLLPEPVFLDAVYVDPYALNITVLTVIRGKFLTADYEEFKAWFINNLTYNLNQTQTLDEKADAVIHK